MWTGNSALVDRCCRLGGLEPGIPFEVTQRAKLLGFFGLVVCSEAWTVRLPIFLTGCTGTRRR
jgi:hypothetical protein